MRFYPPAAPLPELLQTDEFTLRPLTPAHVELDHAALMTSKGMLRLWSGRPVDGWPSDDFSVTENMADMEWHSGDHLERTAFTFTVLNPAEETVLGCVYIVPFQPLMADNPHLAEMISDDFALVRFWAIEPRLADGLDAHLLQALLAWFDREWAFEEVFFHVFEQHQQQIAMLEANGLVRVDQIKLANRGGQFLLYQKAG